MGRDIDLWTGRFWGKSIWFGVAETSDRCRELYDSLTPLRWPGVSNWGMAPGQKSVWARARAVAGWMS